MGTSAQNKDKGQFSKHHQISQILSYSDDFILNPLHCFASPLTILLESMSSSGVASISEIESV